MMRSFFDTPLRIMTAAIDLHAAEIRRKEARRSLSAAYVNWKNTNGVQRVERDTDEWERMLKDTKAEYLAFSGAERAGKNAKRRLDTAIRRLQTEGAA